MPMASAAEPAKPGHDKGGWALTRCHPACGHLVSSEETDMHPQQQQHMSGGVLLSGTRLVRSLPCTGVIRVDVVA
jgi:hypothetical protein